MTLAARMAGLVFGRIATMRFGRVKGRQLPTVCPASAWRHRSARNPSSAAELGFVYQRAADRFTVGVDKQGRGIMAHEIAKLMLEHADTFLDRAEAVRTAVSLGMPLGEIEGYLDWLDTAKPPRSDGSLRSAHQPQPHGSAARGPHVGPRAGSGRRPKAG